MKNVIFLFLIITILYSKDLNHFSVKYCKNILTANNLDEDSKSLKGWLRLFNSPEKLKYYDIYISEEDRKLMIIYFREEYKIKLLKYNKGVK